MCAYLVEGEGVAEDEVDGALDVAVPVVVAAQVVVQRVLRAQEVAPHERRVVRRDPQRHALLAQRAGPRHGGRVLGKPNWMSGQVSPGTRRAQRTCHSVPHGQVRGMRP